MKTKHLDSLSDKRWQNAMSDLRAEIAFDAWTGRKQWNNHPYPNTKIERPVYCTYEDMIA